MKNYTDIKKTETNKNVKNIAKLQNNMKIKMEYIN